jgi:hypothetical protein
MSSSGKAWIRVCAFLAAGLAIVLTVAPAPADVAITGTVSSSSGASNPFSSNVQTHSANLSGGPGSVFTSSTASMSGFGASSGNTGGGALSLSGPPNGVQTISGSLFTTGAASATPSGNGSSFGANTINGLFTLTPANALNTEYAFKTTVTGTNLSGASTGNFAFSSSDSNSFVSLPGVTAGNDHSTVSSNGTTFSNGPTGFSASGSGILLPGFSGFFAQLNGSAGASGSGIFGGSAASSNFGSLSFSITLEPIPEPGTVTLLGLGTLGLAGYGWMRRRRPPVAA